MQSNPKLEDYFDTYFIWQVFFASADRFKAMNHRGFIRIRWSY
ncbi:MAG: hypothetical protein ACK50E_02020 [Bacteroidota bacterium]